MWCSWLRMSQCMSMGIHLWPSPYLSEETRLCFIYIAAIMCNPCPVPFPTSHSKVTLLLCTSTIARAFQHGFRTAALQNSILLKSQRGPHQSRAGWEPGPRPWQSSQPRQLGAGSNKGETMRTTSYASHLVVEFQFWIQWFHRSFYLYFFCYLCVRHMLLRVLRLRAFCLMILFTIILNFHIHKLMKQGLLPGDFC